MASALRSAPVSSLRTLVLNADHSPLAFCSLSRAMALLASDKARPLELSSGAPICSERLSIARPSVVVLSQYQSKASSRARKVAEDYTPSRTRVLARDGFSCQYCGAMATTLDHITPRSRGGRNEWSNLVASCVQCNSKKGARLLKECRGELKLRRQPKPPTNARDLGLLIALLSILRRVAFESSRAAAAQPQPGDELVRADVLGQPHVITRCSATDFETWCKYVGHASWARGVLGRDELAGPDAGHRASTGDEPHDDTVAGVVSRDDIELCPAGPHAVMGAAGTSAHHS